MNEMYIKTLLGNNGVPENLSGLAYNDDKAEVINCDIDAGRDYNPQL